MRFLAFTLAAATLVLAPPGMPAPASAVDLQKSMLARSRNKIHVSCPTKVTFRPQLADLSGTGLEDTGLAAPFSQAKIVSVAGNKERVACYYKNTSYMALPWPVFSKDSFAVGSCIVNPGGTSADCAIPAAQ